MGFLKKFLSTGTEESSKRLVCFVLVFVYVFSHFLVMYFSIEMLNKDLVKNSQDGIFWLILIFGGFIAAEPVLNKLKIGGPKNIVQQDVKDQTIINTDDKTEVK